MKTIICLYNPSDNSVIIKKGTILSCIQTNDQGALLDTIKLPMQGRVVAEMEIKTSHKDVNGKSLFDSESLIYSIKGLDTKQTYGRWYSFESLKKYFDVILSWIPETPDVQDIYEVQQKLVQDYKNLYFSFSK